MPSETKPRKMSFWMQISGISGAAAVTLGAIGAHAFLKKKPEFGEIFKTASQYHFIHALAMLAVSTADSTGALSKNKTDLANKFFLLGKLLFCGSLYLISFREDKTFINKIAPFGGISLICGWLVIAFYP